MLDIKRKVFIEKTCYVGCELKERFSLRNPDVFGCQKTAGHTPLNVGLDYM